MFKALISTLLILFAFCGQTKAQTLNVGDIAIIGVRTDDPDQFVWIALKDIPAGEIIYFTEKGWDANSNDWFNNSEGHITWTSPVGGIACGTIIHIQYGGGAFVTTGGGSTAIADGGWALIAGDQILAYRGGSGHEPAVPFFLHAVNCDYDALDYNATTTWSDGNTTTSSAPSMLPLGMTNGVDCISIYPAPGPEFDNNRYTGTLTGTPASIFASINNAANWTAQNDVAIPMDAAQFATPSVICAPACTAPDVPTITATPSTICPGSSSTLTWTGNLNDATEWHIYTSSCGVGEIGTSTSNSFAVTPGATTTYYIRGEDGAGCVDESTGSCGMVTLNADDAIAPTAVCQNATIYLDGAGTASITSADIDGGSTDDCGTVNLSASQTSFTCADLNASSGNLVISAVYDGPLSGGTPKGVELYVINDIPDLSQFGLGSANNGGGSDGEEFTFPAVPATAGQYIYVASEATEFNNWFGFTPDYTSFILLINGDDAIELFHNGSVIDVFGDINTSGSGEPWDYLDGFAYRNSSTGPDGSTFQLSNWTFSGINAWDGETTNATAATPMAIGTYTPPMGTVDVTLTVDDGNGNTDMCTAQVTVMDTIVPVPDSPSLSDINATCEITSLTDPTATDNCSAVTVTHDATLPITVNTTITWTYSDASNNSSTQIQNVVINDAVFPTASNPLPISVECIGDVPVADPIAVTDEADNCNTPSVVWTGDVSDGGSCPETITRTYTVTDGSGNAIDVTQTITVEDVTDPTASNPANINVECVGDVPAPDVLVVTDEADNCTAAPVVAFVSEVSDGLTCPETITRIYSVTDDCNNSINVTQIIVVGDATNPTASNPANINVECIGDVPAPDVLVVTDEADNCTAAPVVTFVNEVSDGLSCPETITRTYSVTDDCGNSIQLTQLIIVSDVTNPVADVISLSDINSDCPVTPTAPTATDNCSGSLTATPDVAFPIATGGTTTVTWTYTDDCGNTASQTQDIMIAPIDVSTTTNLIIDNQYEITANSTGNTYQWIEGCGTANTVINGATSIDYVPATNGSYAVIVNNGTCSDTSDCIVIDDLGIKTNDFGSNFKIYPNPTFGDLKIDLGSAYNDISVVIYNASGQVIIDKSFKSTSEIELNFEASPGMYVLEIRTKEGENAIVNIIKK